MIVDMNFMYKKVKTTEIRKTLFTVRLEDLNQRMQRGTKRCCLDCRLHMGDRNRTLRRTSQQRSDRKKEDSEIKKRKASQRIRIKRKAVGFKDGRSSA
eukprot:747818-Hanusia_phi.AAC.2